MTLAEPLEFGHEDRRRIYEHVESRGRVQPDVVRESLDLEEGAFTHHLAILKRDGRLAVTGEGALTVAPGDGPHEEVTAGDLVIQIRPARQDDLTGIVGAIRQVAEEGSYIVAESVAQEVDHEVALLRHNELESRMFFVATVEEEVVGWLHLRAPELDKLAHTAEVTVGVLEEYRDHGIGSRLLDRGLEWARERGYEKVYNSVPSSNQGAIAFLEDHGWETEAVRENHYKIGDEYVDEVMLALSL